MLYDHSPEAHARRLTAAAQEREAVQKRITQQGAAERRAELKAAAAQLDEADRERKIKEANDQITAHEQALKVALKAAYTTAQGGNEAGFEAAYPRLRQAWVEAETLRNAEIRPPTAADAVKRTLDLHYGTK